MIKKRRVTTSFLKALEKHAETALTDIQKVVVAKKKYLLANKREILQSFAEGYGPAVIAVAATEELLKAGVPSTFTFISKEGIEMSGETKYTPGEIKKFCESTEAENN